MPGSDCRKSGLKWASVPFFRTRPFARERLSRFAGRAGFRRFFFASLFLLRFLAILPGRTCCGRRRCFARLLPGLRSTVLPRTQCHGRSGGIPSLAAAIPPAVASLTPPRCSYLVHTGTCCGLAGGRSGLFISANAAVPCFPAFSVTVFCRSRPIVFRCKVRAQTGTTCQVLTNGVAAQIFLYRACGLGLRPKIKRIYALSLVHPFAAPTF